LPGFQFILVQGELFGIWAVITDFVHKMAGNFGFGLAHPDTVRNLVFFTYWDKFDFEHGRILTRGQVFGQGVLGGSCFRLLFTETGTLGENCMIDFCLNNKILGMIRTS